MLIFKKVVYFFVRLIRAVKIRFLDYLTTFYYRITCGKYGKNVYICWGAWIQNPYQVFISDNVYIGRNVILGSEFSEGRLDISTGVKINSGANIDYSGNLIIGEKTLISQEVIIYTHSHKLDPYSEPIPLNKVISEGCWLGVRSIILENCRYIAPKTVVGSGAVVTKSIDSGGIYCGVPASQIKSMVY